ncbi:MAG: HEPN domain-containing protein [Candidatus Aenigmatarchaeota archaeon]
MKNIEKLSLLSDAYITARYYFREFSKEKIEKMVELVKKLAKLMKYEKLF